MIQIVIPCGVLCWIPVRIAFLPILTKGVPLPTHFVKNLVISPSTPFPQKKFNQWRSVHLDHICDGLRFWTSLVHLACKGILSRRENVARPTLSMHAPSRLQYFVAFPPHDMIASRRRTTPCKSTPLRCQSPTSWQPTVSSISLTAFCILQVKRKIPLGQGK